MGTHCPSYPRAPPRTRRRRWRWPPPGLAGWYTKYHPSGSRQAPAAAPSG